MRILAVQESDYLARGPHQQHHLMERLSLRGHHIRFLDFDIDWRKKPRTALLSQRTIVNNTQKACLGSQVHLIRPRIVKAPILDYLSIIPFHGAELLRSITEFQPDIIVGFGILNAYLSMRLAKRFQIPFVYYLIDALHTLIPQKRLQFLGKTLESATLRRADRVCVINKTLKQYAVAMGADRTNVHVVSAGIDSQRFHPNLDGTAIRDELGVAKRDCIMFFMGWMYPFSGLLEVAETLIREEHPQLHLLIVGDGEVRPQLIQLRDTANSRQLHLVEWQPYDRIPEYIAAADVCLLPAYNNQIMRNIVPIKMYEYLACGKPVITTRLPGIMREFTTNNGVVYVDKPEEVVARALKMRAHKRHSQYRAQALRFIANHEWDTIVTRFEDLLAQTIATS